jgi:hypothetical protein
MVVPLMRGTNVCAAEAAEVHQWPVTKLLERYIHMIYEILHKVVSSLLETATVKKAGSDAKSHSTQRTFSRGVEFWSLARVVQIHF